MPIEHSASPPLAFNTVLYRTGELTRAISEIATAGYAGIELQPHLTLRLLADKRRKSDFRTALEKSGLRAAAVMCGYLHDDASLELNLRTMRLAADLGSRCLILLPPRPEMASIQEFIGLLQKLANVCEPLGVAVAVHHHAGTVIDTPEAIATFLQQPLGPMVGLCFDFAHYALFADDEVQAAGRFASRTVHVHVKDLARRSGELNFVPGLRNAQQSFRVSGDGVLDVAGCVRVLGESGYQGFLAVEVENFYRTRIDSAQTSATRIKEALT